jgi:rhodanese-related sulfurtransferase
MKKIKSLIAFLMLGLLSSCSAQDKEKIITVDELVAARSSDSSIVVLDVRTIHELDGPLGHIEGVIHIPLQELENRIEELNEFKDSKINVVCRTGRRSGVATSILNEKGFKAKNIIGGMVEYRKKGY